MAAAGGGGAPVTINIDARGAEQGVEARIDAVLARRLPGVVNATKASLMADVNRGGRTAQTFGRRA
jgi:carbamate kinase